MTGKKTYLLAAFCGAFAAFGHAPFGHWWLALIEFAALIWLTAHAARPGWLAWAAGVGYFGASMHWIVEPFLVDIETHGWMAPGALILLAGGLALFWALAGWLAARLTTGPRSRAFAFAVLLTAAEMVRGHIFTGFPWALPAYVWTETPLLGIASLAGAYGLTFLTLMTAALPSVFPNVKAGTILALVALAGLWLTGQALLEPGEGRALGTVRLVQPNVPQHEKWQRDRVPEHLDRLMTLTGEPSDTPPDLVVWPEAAVVYPLDQAGVILAQAARAANGEVVLGINRRAPDDGWHNSMVVVSLEGTVTDAYDKVHLVPFGEYIPFKIEFLRAMAASSGFGFSKGEEVHLIDTALGRALPLICYEGIFPGQIFRAGTRPDYLLLITNDAWFGTFSGPYQHLDQARFRAVEHRLPVVRVANTGVSTVIGTNGQIGRRLNLGTTGHLDLPVETSDRPTLYSRTGDWPLIGLLIVLITALTLARSRNSVAKPDASV